MALGAPLTFPWLLEAEGFGALTLPTHPVREQLDISGHVGAVKPFLPSLGLRGAFLLPQVPHMTGESLSSLCLQ